MTGSDERRPAVAELIPCRIAISRAFGLIVALPMMERINAA
jgi:hypothetical protein